MALVLISSFIIESIKIINVENTKNMLMEEGNLVSNHVTSYYEYLNNQQTYEYLERSLKRQSNELNSRILVCDLDGYVLIDTSNILENENLLYMKDIFRASQGKPSSNIYKFDDDKYAIYTSIPVKVSGSTSGIVFISTDAKYLLDDIRAINHKIYILALVSIIITGIISFMFADLMATPLEKISTVMKQVTNGEYDKRVELKTTNDEYKILMDSFNSMIVKFDQVDEQRKLFVSNVSHELRTPLTSLKIISDSLLQSENVPIEVYDEFMADINSEVDRLSNIIDDLLSLVNLEKSELELDYSMNSINHLVQTVINKIKPIAERKNIKIDFREYETVQLSVDSGKILQCFFNIIGNAVKYTNNDGKVIIAVYTKKNQVIIKVEDSGIGIAEEKLPYIFDRFYRTDKARSRSTGGTGLGLSIAQQIVNLHQGDINIESVLGRGTKVFISLPIDVLLTQEVD